MTQSINELKSYTEYNVSTPTSVFTIGFQYEYNVDKVNVYVNAVEATAAGYTVLHDSHGTVSLTPAVPAGVVRLVRETDIDYSAHAFSAGAKFTAGNMDENFRQLRHSQQEVRDGFVVLEQNTSEGIAAVYQAANDAQTAAIAAQAAANTATASEAAIKDIIVDGKVSTNAVIDKTGQTQQEVNDETVSVTRFGAKGDGITDDTVAFNLAAATGKNILVPKTDASYLISSATDSATWIIEDGALISGLAGVGYAGEVHDTS